jgi:DNA polymerase/3'-5' exonuclease PolX
MDALTWPGLTKAVAAALKVRTNATKKQLERVYDDLPSITKAHVKYNIKRIMRLNEARIIANDIRNHLTIGNRTTQTMVVGSIRRAKPIIKDIDILVIVPKQLTQSTTSPLTTLTTPQELMTYSSGARRRSMVIKTSRAIVKVDLFLAYEDELPYALLHHTGSAQFNIHARAKAKHLNLILNQYGLYYRKNNSRIRNWRTLKTEKDVLERLKITYKEPNNRDN